MDSGIAGIHKVIPESLVINSLAARYSLRFDAVDDTFTLSADGIGIVFLACDIDDLCILLQAARSISKRPN